MVRSVVDWIFLALVIAGLVFPLTLQLASRLQTRWRPSSDLILKAHIWSRMAMLFGAFGLLGALVHACGMDGMTAP